MLPANPEQRLPPAICEYAGLPLHWVGASEALADSRAIRRASGVDLRRERAGLLLPASEPVRIAGGVRWSDRRSPRQRCPARPAARRLPLPGGARLSWRGEDRARADALGAQLQQRRGLRASKPHGHQVRPVPDPRRPNLGVGHLRRHLPTATVAGGPASAPRLSPLRRPRRWLWVAVRAGRANDRRREVLASPAREAQDQPGGGPLRRAMSWWRAES